jgi:hypothetical protein
LSFGQSENQIILKSGTLRAKKQVKGKNDGRDVINYFPFPPLWTVVAVPLTTFFFRSVVPFFS